MIGNETWCDIEAKYKPIIIIKLDGSIILRFNKVYWANIPAGFDWKHKCPEHSMVNDKVHYPKFRLLYHAFVQHRDSKPRTNIRYLGEPQVKIAQANGLDVSMEKEEDKPTPMPEMPVIMGVKVKRIVEV